MCMPDQPSSRRRFQFRLRTLLIGVALVAVACCVIADRQRLIHERDTARDEVDLIKAKAESMEDAAATERKTLREKWRTMEGQLDKVRLQIDQQDRELMELRKSARISECASATQP